MRCARHIHRTRFLGNAPDTRAWLCVQQAGISLAQVPGMAAAAAQSPLQGLPGHSESIVPVPAAAPVAEASVAPSYGGAQPGLMPRPGAFPPLKRPPGVCCGTQNCS
jgi:hypothetical protein